MSKKQNFSRNYFGRVQHASRLRRPRRWAVISIAVVVSLLGFIGVGWTLVTHDLNKQIQSVSGTQKLLERTPPDSYTGRALNVLVIGSDSREGEGNTTLTNNDDVTQRSDTTMLMHISKDRSRVQVVSIQRDTKVDIPSCKRTDGSTVKAHPDTQFNWAFSLGGGDRGDISSALACTWKTVESITGLTVDEAIIVDFNGFQHMVNALNGINVYLPTAIKDSKNSGLVIEKPGCYHFNGQQALSYARVRKGITGGDGSDWQRIERQQEVVGIIMRTALDMNVMSNIGSLYAFLKAGLNALTVSDGLNTSTKLAGLGWSLKSLSPENLQFIMMPTYEDPRDHNRMLIREKEAEKLWEAIRNDQAIPVGMTIKDGNGNTYMVTDPNAAAAKNNADGNGSSNGTSSQDGQKSASTTQARTGETLQKVETKIPKGSTVSSGEELEKLKQKCHETHF